jgi:hypothetical protein
MNISSIGKENVIMKKIEAVLYFERSTKGSHLYKNTEEKWYGLYISKHHLEGPPPAIIKVTIVGVEFTAEDAELNVLKGD